VKRWLVLGILLVAGCSGGETRRTDSRKEPPIPAPKFPTKISGGPAAKPEDQAKPAGEQLAEEVESRSGH
jgi:hypothetical protein